MQFKTNKNATIAYSNPGYNFLKAKHFSPEYWQQNHQVIGTSCGRRTTWFVQHEKYFWVLRHYWRGGLMAKLSDDLYFFSGIHYTRPVMELRLLEEMFHLGLPVPKPIAAKVERIGLWYRGDILIEQIRDAKDLHAILSQDQMPSELWQQLGRLLARFHNYGIYHADLNIKNILLSGEQFYLIDFDRGELKKPKKRWQQANIARLRRSFVKEQDKLAYLNFNEKNWQDLMTGYQSAIK